MRVLLIATAAMLGLLATGCDGFGQGEADVSTLDAPVADPTWEAHIAPMIDVHCVACHGPVPSHGAPSQLHLDGYEGLAPVADLCLERMTETPSRPMPTLDRPRMSDAELTTFATWVELGLPREGDAP